MESFLYSTAIVAVGEIGDKTQLLSIVLAARYRAPWIIAWAVLLATTANHALAAATGEWLRYLLTPQVLRYVVGIGFLAMAAWVLVPDKADDVQAKDARGWAVFGITFVTFFLAEMGDKTQIATIALAARFGDFFAVLAGTTLGMMLANVPAIWLGARAAHAIPLKLARSVAALLMAVSGVYALAVGLP